MVELTNVQKNYGNFRLNISLKLPAGKVSGIVGRNGAGKSTLIKSILGLISIDGGNALVLGKDPRKLTPADKEMIGTAFSDSGFSTYLYINDIIRILKNSYTSFDEASFRSYCEENKLPMDKRIRESGSPEAAPLGTFTQASGHARHTQKTAFSADAVFL